jgi:hypothetical protein
VTARRAKTATTSVNAVDQASQNRNHERPGRRRRRECTGAELMSGAPVGSAHRRRLRGVVQVLRGEITTALALRRPRTGVHVRGRRRRRPRGEGPTEPTNQRTNETKERNQEKTIKEQGSRSKNETNKINKQINQQTQRYLDTRTDSQMRSRSSPKGSLCSCNQVVLARHFAAVCRC